MAEVECPKCGNKVASLQSLDPGVVEKLRESGEDVPAQVCAACSKSLGGTARRGSVLMAREKAREQKKLMLWKSRVNLIKNARGHMQDKMFSDAAVSYEKYLKVLEIVFDASPGSLTPDHFKESARTQELTIVASVYWDLLRIYDTSQKYGERQSQAAKKLATFLKFTPIYPDILRRAETFQKTAKNPSVIRQFLKQAQENKSRCFIATAAFESANAAEVVFLSQYRDYVLNNHLPGKIFVKAYYLVSPSVAALLDRNPKFKPVVRNILRKIISFLAARQ